MTANDRSGLSSVDEVKFYCSAKLTMQACSFSMFDAPVTLALFHLRRVRFAFVTTNCATILRNLTEVSELHVKWCSREA